MDERTFDIILAWLPPEARHGISALGGRLGACPRKYWTKTGPDAIELQQSHRLTIQKQDGKLRHICITNERGHVEVEMSGEVILNPDMALAESFDVCVENPDLQPFGTLCSWQALTAATLAQLLLLLGRQA